MKKGSSILLALFLLAAAAAVQAQFTYTTNNGAITLTQYTGTGGSVVISNFVTSIAMAAFEGCASLTSVTVPGGVTNIGGYAFNDCIGLLSITVDAQNSFYSSVSGVLFDKGQDTLIQCPAGLSGSYTIPGSVSSIGATAFDGCSSLTNVTIPGNVTSIGAAAFSGCLGLTGVTIPASVKSIGYAPFGGCMSLAAIKVDAANSCFSSVNGVLFDEQQTLLIEYPNGVCGSYAIPGSVTSIGMEAFVQCYNLTNVTIPGSVTSIGGLAFYQSGLTAITIPGSVTSMGTGAFYDCYALTNAMIANGVPSIGEYAFESCGRLTSVVIPGSVTNFGYGAFEYCDSLTNVTVSSGVSTIGQYAFCGCSALATISIPASVSSIGDGALCNCANLASVYFMGNAPTADSTVFSSDTKAAACYLPGASGWSAFSANTGLPAALWNPLGASGHLSVGVQTSQFGFNFAGPANLVILVDACTNLACPVWVPIHTNTLTNGWCCFSDPQWKNFPGRFYRISSQ